MARNYGTMNTAIWADADFRSLPIPAQHLYSMLWTHQTLSYCGVADWRPARLAPLAGWLTPALVEMAGDCLESRHYIVRDLESEEVLLRSWVRFDGLLRKPRMAVSMVKAYTATASNEIRGVVVAEIHKLRGLEPDLECWRDQRVLDVLDDPVVDAKSREVPIDPFGGDASSSLLAFCTAVYPAFAAGLPQTEVGFTPPLLLSPSPAPTPCSPGAAAEAEDDGSAKSKRATQRPKNWMPNESHRQYATEQGVDIGHEAQQFAAHHEAKGSTFKSWDAAFRTWLGNAAKWQRGNVHQLRRDAQPFDRAAEAAMRGVPENFV